MPEFKASRDYIQVPAEFIEKYMIRATSMNIKVYLYGLLLAAENRSMGTMEMAEALDIYEHDVKNAFRYWKSVGLTAYNGKSVEYLLPSKEKPQEEKAESGISESAEYISQKQELSELCMLAQEILAQELTPKDMETIYWIHDSLGFSPEVILMLLEYCASKNKLSVPYAEKVAVAWAEKGVNTVETAEEYIKNENSSEEYLKTVRRALGISSRKLSRAEADFLEKWHTSYNMNADVVALAYEYCTLQTGKLSFPYMDTILGDWNKLDIHDAESAKKEHETHNGKSGTRSKTAGAENVNHGELESLMHNKFD